MTEYKPFATVEDLIKRWGRELSEDERKLAEIRLSDVSDKLRMQARSAGISLDKRVYHDKLYRRIVRRIVCDVVKRSMLQPNDSQMLTDFSETAGPFSISGKVFNPSGDYYFTHEERLDLGFENQDIAFRIDLK